MIDRTGAAGPTAPTGGDPSYTRRVRVRAAGTEFSVALAGHGDAPLLLCLHGFPECGYSWRHQLRGLSDRFLVAAPDLRGYGDSEKPEHGYELPALAADVPALIRALGHDRAFVVGHDWGGLIAYAAAALHPRVVRRLAVMSCPHPAATARALRSLDQIRKSWYIFAIQIPFLFDRRLARDDCAIVPRIFMAGARRRSMLRPEDLEVFRAALARPGAIDRALRYYRTNLSVAGLLAGRLRIPEVSVPTLVLLGRDDPFVGPRLFDGHERHFTGPYEIHYLPGCGHWAQQEVPDVVNDAIRVFARDAGDDRP